MILSIFESAREPDDFHFLKMARGAKSRQNVYGMCESPGPETHSKIWDQDSLDPDQLRGHC